MAAKLTELKNGEHGRIEVLEAGHDFRHKVRSLGIREGKVAIVKACHPFGGPFVVEIDRRQITLGRRMAAKVIVERIPAHT